MKNERQETGKVNRAKLAFAGAVGLAVGTLFGSFTTAHYLERSKPKAIEQKAAVVEDFKKKYGVGAPHEEFRSSSFGYDVRVADMRGFQGSTRVVEMLNGTIEDLPWQVIATDHGIDGIWENIYFQRTNGGTGGRLNFDVRGNYTADRWTPSVNDGPLISGTEILRLKSLLGEVTQETTQSINRARDPYDHTNNKKEVNTQ